MSYILDALKKNQAEQTGGDAGITLHNANASGGWPTWLGWLLALVLAMNLLILVWLVILPRFAQDNSTATATATKTGEPTRTQSSNSSSRAINPAEQSSTNTTSTNQYSQEVQAPTRTPSTTPTPRPTAPAPVATAPAPQTIDTVPLSQLPATEQVLYNGFSYTTHIYTDDPDFCAIVIDGQRLTPGDAFKGLIVSQITENGVIFEESRSGIRRHIEVNLLELWED